MHLSQLNQRLESQLAQQVARQAERNQLRPRPSSWGARDNSGVKVLRAIQPVLMRLPPRFGKRSGPPPARCRLATS